MPPNASSIQQIALSLRQLALVAHRSQNLCEAVVWRPVYLSAGKAKENNPLRPSQLILSGIVLKLLGRAMVVFSVALDDGDGIWTPLTKNGQVIDVLVEEIPRPEYQSLVPYNA